MNAAAPAADWAPRVDALHRYWAKRLFTRDAGGAARGGCCRGGRGHVCLFASLASLAPRLPANAFALPCPCLPALFSSDISPVMFAASLVPGAWARSFKPQLEALRSAGGGAPAPAPAEE